MFLIYILIYNEEIDIVVCIKLVMLLDDIIIVDFFSSDWIIEIV